MKARGTALRRHVARAVLGVVASWRLATGQGSSWVATPSSPTVGDTIWLERTITVPAGWRVRAGKLELAADVEPLGDPAVVRSPTGWVVRYPVVAWSPGPHRLRSEEHTSELQSQSISYAVFCLKKKKSGVTDTT